MTDEEFNLIDNFKMLMRCAMTYAKYSHDYIFDEGVDDLIAVSYLNVAASKFSAAESLYYSRYELLQRPEAESIFHLFETYLREVMNNVRTNHSHQWSDIEFNKLKDEFDYSAFAFENS